jgi:phosphoglycerate dehydrogenase-like enzyme
VARIRRAWPGADPSGPPEAVLAWSYDPEPLLPVLSADPAPRWVQTRAVGVDPRVARRAATAGVTLTNGSGAHGPAVAEHVLALVLALLRRIPEMTRAQAERRWAPPAALRELAGLETGVLGMGDLGRCTARLLQSCGVRVRGLRRSARPVAGVPRMYGPEQRSTFLDGLDVLVVAVPLTAETVGMIGAADLSRLAPGALLVNVARGPVVRTEALLGALRGGHLAGAALDVFDEEPLPPGSALWTEPGVLVSPHCADVTAATDERFLTLYLDRVARFRQGRPITGVDPVLGY